MYLLARGKPTEERIEKFEDLPARNSSGDAKIQSMSDNALLEIVDSVKRSEFLQLIKRTMHALASGGLWPKRVIK